MMQRALFLSLCALYVLLCCYPEVAFSRLLSVQIISRHGIRAPNPTITQLCPANMINIKKYDTIGIDAGGLTGKGMTELFMLGHYTRHHYMQSSGKPTGILSDNYRSDEIIVWAVSEDRTIQSATAFGNGLYPHISAPYDFAGGQGLPPPIPIYQLLDGHDNFLEARKAQCKKQLQHDSDEWDAVHGPSLWGVSPYAEALSALGSICGVNLNTVWQGSGDNFGDCIKDITDNLWFDQLEGFHSLKGLNFELFSTVRELAVRQLMGRLYSTKEQIVYMPGDMPEGIVNNFRQSMKGAGRKVYSYHGHREMMYAIAIFLNLDFNISFPGLPHGEILPGGSIFIELHEKDSLNIGGAATPTIPIKGDVPTGSSYAAIKPGDENYFVRAFLWYPCYNKSGVNGDQLRMGPLDDLAHCQHHHMKIADCQEDDCPLPQVLAYIESRVNFVNGDWKSLCPVNPSTPTQLMNALSISSASESELRVVVSLFSFALIFLLIFVAIGVFFLCVRQRQQKNHAGVGSINDGGANENTSLLPHA